jgi:hypothetical protein
MVSFKTTLRKFEEKGEKTGWTYIEIPVDVANQIKPNTRKSFRVKGRIDDFVLKMVSLLPMGDGGFIIPINNEMRKVIHKKEGKIVEVSLEEDTDEFVISPDLMACLEDEPKALAEFNKLPKSHQKYYSNWIESAKTIETKTKRILMTVNGFNMGMDYGEMMRYYRDLEK